MKKVLPTLALALATAFLGLAPRASAAAGDVNRFDLARSAGVTQCLPNARGHVTITDVGPVQRMHVAVSGLPANKEFTLFLIQVPKAPFGLVWYQGDIVTNANGDGAINVRGIFSKETFLNAPGPAAAPAVFPDNAIINPTTAPIQIYHVGLWFADFNDAQAAGCPATQTQFDGDHVAGLQVLNTSNFADDQGPLRNIE